MDATFRFPNAILESLTAINVAYIFIGSKGVSSSTCLTWQFLSLEANKNIRHLVAIGVKKVTRTLFNEKNKQTKVIVQ